MIILFMMTKHLVRCVLQKQNMLLTSEGKYRFLGIFIWFDRARQALQEYEYKKILTLFPIQNLKEIRKIDKNFIYLALERVC